ncbi:MAG: TrkH family potassium uptake protein, partial [Phycisphaerales bacterium]|nr:TrkH family potassium uptake protein [Phycisphaerales bacterium]
IFMIFAGLNFGLFFQAWKGRLRDVLRDTELRVYLVMLAVGSAIVVVSLLVDGAPIILTTGEEVDPTLVDSLRQGVFTTVSVQTTTGFCTSDFNIWPFAAQAVLVAMMFVGGCSGSTAGGIKVIRVWMLLRVLFAQVERFIRPRLTRPLRIGGSTIEEDVQLSTIAFFLGALLIIAIGWILLLVLEGCSPTTAATASVASFCTIGPGLDAVGAVENYGWFSTGGKITLSALMILGRLEVFAIVVLCRPAFWRNF